MDESSSSIPEHYRQRLRRAYERLGTAYPHPFERMERSVVQSLEHQVSLWERLAAAIVKMRVDAPEIESQQVEKILCKYVFGLLMKEDLADPVVKRIVRLTDGLFVGSQRDKVLGTDANETRVRR